MIPNFSSFQAIKPKKFRKTHETINSGKSSSSISFPTHFQKSYHRRPSRATSLRIPGKNSHFPRNVMPPLACLPSSIHNSTEIKKGHPIWTICDTKAAKSALYKTHHQPPRSSWSAVYSSADSGLANTPCKICFQSPQRETNVKPAFLGKFKCKVNVTYKLTIC